MSGGSWQPSDPRLWRPRTWSRPCAGWPRIGSATPAPSAEHDLEIRGDGARIRIRDDGKGFDVTAVAPPEDPPRLGLLGMRERALAAGGNLEVRSRPGAGTLVEAEVAMVG